ncbi:MAG TPA: TRAP transporter small permease [Proteiniclasticum sp.]|nr:TRAP transporter small permease [Proteiniclasticum sp.]
MEKLLLVPKLLGKLNLLIMKVVQFLMVAIMSVLVVIVFYSVLSRMILNASIAWAEELTRILFIWLVFMGAVHVLHSKGHLGLTIIIDRISPKKQLFFEVVGWILIIAVTYAMINGGTRIVEVVRNSRTPALGLPGSMKYEAVLVAGYLMILTSIEHLFTALINLVASLRGKKVEVKN